MGWRAKVGLDETTRKSSSVRLIFAPSSWIECITDFAQQAYHLLDSWLPLFLLLRPHIAHQHSEGVRVLKNFHYRQRQQCQGYSLDADSRTHPRMMMLAAPTR